MAAAGAGCGGGECGRASGVSARVVEDLESHIDEEVEVCVDPPETGCPEADRMSALDATRFGFEAAGVEGGWEPPESGSYAQLTAVCGPDDTETEACCYLMVVERVIQ